MPPILERAKSIKASISLGLRRSAAWYKTLLGLFWKCFRALSTSPKPLITTSAPCRAKVVAMHKPMPLVAPVTTAFLPRTIVFGSNLSKENTAAKIMREKHWIGHRSCQDASRTFLRKLSVGNPRIPRTFRSNLRLTFLR